MRGINIHDAKTHLSRLVEEAAPGEGLIIAKAGRPMVKVPRLVAAEAPVRHQRIGSVKSEFTVPDDFDTLCQEAIERMFYGEAQ